MGKKIINQKSIAVLLSTYNGEKYIAELIESLMAQTCDDFTLFIRDDISKDKTPEIIAKYEAIYKSKIIIIPSSQNLGSKSSFLSMLDMVDSEYYMFCDQDDIWENDKIGITLKAIKAAEHTHPNTPIIVHTDLKLVDGRLETIAESYWNHNKLLVDYSHEYKYFCHYNDVTGCAMMFNSRLKDVSIDFLNKSLPYFIHHDHYLALICIANGGLIVPIFETTILFRRHGDNATDPLTKKKSIFSKPLTIKNYIEDFYKRWRFFKNIQYVSFFSFVKGKFAVAYTINKRNHGK